jgi:hypothetical protein
LKGDFAKRCHDCRGSSTVPKSKSAKDLLCDILALYKMIS